MFICPNDGIRWFNPSAIWPICNIGYADLLWKNAFSKSIRYSKDPNQWDGIFFGDIDIEATEYSIIQGNGDIAQKWGDFV